MDLLLAEWPAIFAAMPGNSFGHLFRLTTFGESHGAAIGGVIDGCPAGLVLDLAAIQQELDRRRPGSTPLGTTRSEGDVVELLSGILATDDLRSEDTGEMVPAAIHRTLGTPIGFMIRNTDAKSTDYDHLKDVYRPGHADLSWEEKYGIRDHRGGGRSSARETACRVVAGAVARQLLAKQGITVSAYVSQVGSESVQRPYQELELTGTWSSDVRCPDAGTAARMIALIEQVRSEGDSIGGVVSCVAQGVPPGLGEPVFDRLEADLAKAMLSINATKGFQVGSGFATAHMRGSEHNDALVRGWRKEHTPFVPEGMSMEKGAIRSATNHSGGTQGGISSGEDIRFDVAFKPPATIAKAQRTVNTRWEEVTLEAKGRHDPCVVPRAVPVVEAMACLVLADHVLRHRSSRMEP